MYLTTMHRRFPLFNKSDEDDANDNENNSNEIISADPRHLNKSTSIQRNLRYQRRFFPTLKGCYSAPTLELAEIRFLLALLDWR